MRLSLIIFTLVLVVAYPVCAQDSSVIVDFSVLDEVEEESRQEALSFNLVTDKNSTIELKKPPLNVKAPALVDEKSFGENSESDDIPFVSSNTQALPIKNIIEVPAIPPGQFNTEKNSLTPKPLKIVPAQKPKVDVAFVPKPLKKPSDLARANITNMELKVESKQVKRSSRASLLPQSQNDDFNQYEDIVDITADPSTSINSSKGESIETTSATVLQKEKSNNNPKPRIIVKFDVGQIDLRENTIEALRTGLLIPLNKNKSQDIEIISYATGVSEKPNSARKISLDRALLVEKFLIDNDVMDDRITIKALGDLDDLGKNYIEIFFLP